MNPEQLTFTPNQQNLFSQEIQKMAMQTLEVQLREDVFLTNEVCSS